MVGIRPIPLLLGGTLIPRARRILRPKPRANVELSGSSILLKLKLLPGLTAQASELAQRFVDTPKGLGALNLQVKLRQLKCNYGMPHPVRPV